jgi:hypothetical protein
LRALHLNIFEQPRKKEDNLVKKSLNGNVPNIPTHVSYYKQYKSIIVLAVIMFDLLIVAGIAAKVNADEISDKKIYVFSWSKIAKLISRTGYPDFIDHKMSRDGSFDTISRNEDGTSINVINRTNKRAIVFKCDGTVKHIKLPTRLSWLDNDNNILAWSGSTDNRSTKYLKGHSPVSFEAIDPSGQYFISYFDNKYFAIASVAKPEIPLARVNIIGSQFLYIFFKGNKLYVFGHTERNLFTPLKAFIYERNGEKIKLIEEFEIPREKKHGTPYVVEDFSPWSYEILLLDARSFPSISKWYIYNLSTKELKYYGLATEDRGLFLQCDILKRVEENKKSKMSSD